MPEWTIFKFLNPLKPVEMFLDSQFVCMKIGPKRVNVENAPRFGHFGFTLLNYFMILQNNGLECITENLVL